MKSKIILIGILCGLVVSVLALHVFAAKPAKNPIATVKTNKGTFVMELYPKETPITVKNFIKLAKKKYYNGLTFHRYVPGFVIQGGDPEGTGAGGPGYTIRDETNKTLTHVKGAVAMAKTMMPDSAGSQFYITLVPRHDLDGNYTVFGKVITGMNVVEKLRQGDKMLSITISEQKSSAKRK